MIQQGDIYWIDLGQPIGLTLLIQPEEASLNLSIERSPLLFQHLHSILDHHTKHTS